jgi:hypothetical protein
VLRRKKGFFVSYREENNQPTIAALSKDLPRQCGFQIEVLAKDDWSKSTVAIGCDRNPPPIAALVVVTEHLMTLVAMNSAADFEKALQLLCEGARTNRVMMADGKKVQ